MNPPILPVGAVPAMSSPLPGDVWQSGVSVELPKPGVNSPSMSAEDFANLVDSVEVVSAPQMQKSGTVVQDLATSALEAVSNAGSTAESVLATLKTGSVNAQGLLEMQVQIGHSRVMIELVTNTVKSATSSLRQVTTVQ